MYSEALWEEFSRQEGEHYKMVKGKDGKPKRRYLKKGYQHFDPRFWFPERKEYIRMILLQGLKINNLQYGRMEWHAFAPFIKILAKTPRYKFQSAEGKYDLETKIRPISYSSHVDSLILGYYSFALTRQYESYIHKQGFSDCVLAYRSDLGGKCNVQFAKEVFDEVRRRGHCTAIALDIKGYFDHIDHRILLEKWQKVVGGKLPEDQYKVYKTLTRYTYINRNSLLKKYSINLKKLAAPVSSLLELVPGNKTYEKYDQLRQDQLLVKNNRPDKNTGKFMGVPQGSAISALLSNIYLIDFDQKMQDKARQEGFLYRRYCDDILIVCDPAKARELQQFTINLIAQDYLLTIQDKKVELTEFQPNSKGVIRAFNRKKLDEQSIQIPDPVIEHRYYKSLQYLGFEFNGQHVHIRSSSLSRYFRKMTARIVKTISMAYSGKVQAGKIWKEQLFHRYTHLGKRNFLRYAYNASKKEYINSQGETKEGMDDPAIRKQVRRHFDFLVKKLETKNMQRFTWKVSKGKLVKLKVA